MVPWGAAARGDRPRVLVHAVSVGEVNALRPLVPLLVERYEVVVSSTTDTGLRRAQELFGEGRGAAAVVRYPLDATWAVRRFLDVVRPDAVALVELEVWPNFVGECARRGVPVGVINGRLSARSFRGYARWRRWIGPTFARLAAVGAQDGAYAERFCAMGVEAGRVSVTGSMKWDTVPRVREHGEVPGERALSIARELGIDRKRPVVVAGSTAGGEEALVREAVDSAAEALGLGAGGVQVVVAARKPERFAEAAAALPGCVRRSEARGAASAARATGSSTGRYLLDTIGELGAVYELADAVVMGRSFGLGKAGRGGSDPIEPAALGRAVVVGEHMANFESIAGALTDAGAIVRTDAAGLARVVAGLLGSRERREAMARAAAACVAEHRGASVRHGELIAGLIAGPSRGPIAGSASGRG
jgi:3-deoxy-D-manno-octulosonic-acid transferase